MAKPSIDDTINFIKIAHAGQFDKGGVEYWKHPVSVMYRLGPDASEDCKLGALLHDVIEDTQCTEASLRDLGYPDNIISSVTRLTKPTGVAYLKCIEELAASGDQVAIAVKIADNLDNLDPERLARLPLEKQGGQEKYRRSIEILTRAHRRKA
jgi:(p)ppGpp synthase/HD superfamily hydrolase